MAQRPILIVEDNDTNMFVLESMLESFGHATVSARDGAQGVAMAIEHRPSLVLMDLRMPGMNGIEAAREIRRLMPEGCPPMVAVSATVTREHRDAAAEAGFIALVPKPIDIDALDRLVQSLVGRA